MLKVASPGIEPGSGASETLILSIVRRGLFILYSLFLIFNFYLPIAAMLLPNILTAMAINITPKNFLTTINPLGPNACSIHFKDIIVVSVPDPAIKGKAMGTTLPLLGLLSGLKNSSPRIISKPRMKITILPATAKDCTSRPKRFKNGFPKNKKRIIKAPDATVACVERMEPPILSFKEIKIGIEPRISITAKRVKAVSYTHLTLPTNREV